MDGMVHIPELVAYLKREDMVIAPRSMVIPAMVNGVPIPEYRNRVLQKPYLSALEISNAQLWGPIGKHAVKNVIKKEVPKEEIKKFKNTIKIPRSIVRNIALQRGCATG